MKKDEGEKKIDDKERIEIQRREYEEKLEKYKKEVENGTIKEIPEEMKKFKPKKRKAKTHKSYKKVGEYNLSGKGFQCEKQYY